MFETKNISKSFGKLAALSDVSFKVEKGEIFGIAGPNGAGKTTLFNIISAIYPPSSGRVSFEGRDITGLKPHQICQLGIARTFQIPTTFQTLNVYDNIRVGATFGPGKPELIPEVLEFLDLNDNQLTLVDTVRRDQQSTVVFSNDAQALLEWRVLPAAGIPLPLLPPDIGAKGHFEHRESAEITVGYQDSGTFHPFTLLLGHATSLVYPGHGAIKASLNLGLDVEDLLSVGLAWRLAFRAAIEAKLTF